MDQTKAAWGAMYVGHLEQLKTFDSTKEIGEIIVWDGREMIGEISEIDRYLLELICGESFMAGGQKPSV